VKAPPSLIGGSMSTKTKKDDLYQETLDKFDIRLDRRLSLASMMEQRELIEQRQANPVEEKPEKSPFMVKNKRTGLVFRYQEAYKNNPNLEVIEWRED
jgi:hypothetical protein